MHRGVSGGQKKRVTAGKAHSLFKSADSGAQKLNFQSPSDFCWFCAGEMWVWVIIINQLVLFTIRIFWFLFIVCLLIWVEALCPLLDFFMFVQHCRAKTHPFHGKYFLKLRNEQSNIARLWCLLRFEASKNSTFSICKRWMSWKLGFRTKFQRAWTPQQPSRLSNICGTWLIRSKTRRSFHSYNRPPRAITCLMMCSW